MAIPVSFLLHVKYTLSYRIVSYRRKSVGPVFIIIDRAYRSLVCLSVRPSVRLLHSGIVSKVSS